MKIHFHGAILPFGLAVGLRVEYGRNFPLNFEKVTKQWLELWDEKWTPVGNDRVWKAVVLYYHV